MLYDVLSIAEVFQNLVVNDLDKTILKSARLEATDDVFQCSHHRRFEANFVCYTTSHEILKDLY